MRRHIALQKHFVRNLFRCACSLSRSLGSAHASSRRLFGALSSALRADAPELESCLGFDDLAVHFKNRISEEINRSAFRFRIDHQIAALGQFKPISRIMTKIVISQLWVLPRFTDIHRNPLTVCEKFGPAMVTFDLPLILVGRNGRPDGKTSRYVDASRQSDEIRVEIRAVS